MIDTAPVIEKGILVSVICKDQKYEQVKDYLDELSFLYETAGGVEVYRVYQNLEFPNPRTYVGKGKLEELKQAVEEMEADNVIFDDELTPSQLRNLEEVLCRKVLDRTSLILDIFARNARTAHSKVQVELAQCQYMLPRLTGLWTHLERQRGGIGMRGPGETEIETDRRILRNKISQCKEELQKIDMQKSIQRGNRGGMKRVALVGYTNVGKSTILNLLAGTQVLAENKLFATLDTTVRKIVFDNKPFLISDTVGFIRKLPTSLLESFKSTLDEVREADLLLHVVDISHHNYEQQIEIVRQTLSDIKAADKPVIYVFNKIDAYRSNYESVNEQDNNDGVETETTAFPSLEELKKLWIAKQNTPCVFISAETKENINELKSLVANNLNYQR
ncbi:MAG: GTPase HflX [Bacteroidales bacterium]|jgi:GTPase|nr:GTPase HflX [Bacteroidales bacterium]MDD3151457.1 GTPase HflX [Bacteroidales bacterium]MDD3914408.1 GTPase HflX [Bacteroidales bacterium]MDD4634589.1 GTPase HflX [Bacteroidales bacterium]